MPSSAKVHGYVSPSGFTGPSSRRFFADTEVSLEKIVLFQMRKIVEFVFSLRC